MKTIIEKIDRIKDDTLDNYRNSITRKRYLEDIEKIKETCAGVEPADTDFTLIKHLFEVFQPVQIGVISLIESEQITDELQLNRRTVLQLRNLRDMVVMIGDIMNVDIDKVSAVAHVIDTVLISYCAEI